MHLILTGATGRVGSSVLDAMLNTDTITKISILSRREVAMANDAKDPRINVIIHRDFESYPAATLDQLRGADGCVWALGISQSEVAKDEYVKITRDYALAGARAFSTLSEGKEKPFRFIYVSGEGATQKPGRFTPLFGVVKGETETKLGDLTTELKGKLQADTARPAVVDPTGHAAIKPYISMPMWMSGSVAVLNPVLSRFAKGTHSPTGFLGQVLTKMAMGELDGKMEGEGAFRLGGSWVVGNVGLRRMMGI